ncbi:MAG: phospholipid carrier-dependent glycosyltransferase [Chloroflexi bacterium]|nr:phospholipid carrier-dependent glycosyltransferase [Chloroflexota bacterium]MCC6891860.1 phospholipid carrier-dependent glycosyltransferase [Anaerolineae bacterium]
MYRAKWGSVYTQISWMAGLFALSLLLRLLILRPTAFDGLYGQDAYAYYDYAQSIQTSLQTVSPLPPFFWPLGYPMLIALGQAITGTQPAIAQTINLLLGAALSPLVYFITRQPGRSHFASVSAALIITFCGQALQSSMVIMSDIPALFWGTLSAALLVTYISAFNNHQRSGRWLVLAAVTFIFAVLTRWLYLILAVPFGFALLITWRGQVPRRAVTVALLASGLVYLPQFLFSRTNPAPTLNHEWVEGWSIANVVSSSFTNPDGHFDYEKLNAVYYAQPYYDSYYLSPLFTPFILVGLWTLYKTSRWRVILIGGWVLLPYLFLAGIPYQNIRFPLIVTPAVALLVGIGLDITLTFLHRHPISRLPRRIMPIFIMLLLIFGLTHMGLHATEVISTFITNQQQDKLAAKWAGAYIPAKSTVYTFGLTLTLKHYTALNIYELYYETPDTLADKWQRGKADYLLINVWNIENQWAGRDPQADYHWLRDQRGLIRLGKYNNYTLFKIRG